MASCSTARWVSTAPYMKLTVTEQSSSGDSSVLAWTLQYITDYPASTTGNIAYKVIIAGSTAKDSSYDINGKTGTYTVASGTVTVSKSTAARQIAFSITAWWELTWSGVYCDSKVAESSITIAAKTSYTVRYDANGGSGAPSAQTKWYNTALTLSSAKPTRTGYTFKGWATSSGGAVAYAAGASYTANAAATLYAVWEAVTYPVTYNANGGSGAPSSQTKTYDVNLTLSSTKPTRENYNFVGWGTSASSTTVAYAAGAIYTENAAITLYAIWELAYILPRISGFSAFRCDSAGNADEEGTYAKVSFGWATDKSVSEIKIAWASTSGGSGSASASESGTSGNITQIVGSGALSADYTYTLTVTVSDSGGSTIKESTLPGKSYVIDFLSGGNGVAFGKAAELSEYLDSAFNIRGRKNLGIDGNATIGGTLGVTGNTTVNKLYANDNMYDKFGTIVGNGLSSYLGSGSAAINPDTTTDHLILTDKNTPMGNGYFMYIMTFFFEGKSTSNNRAQIAIPYGQAGSMYHRYFGDGAWTEWRRHTNEDEFADHIIARGSTSDWMYWAKFKNGLGICVSCAKQNGNFPSTTWGNLYRGGTIAGFAYPFTFSSVPSVFFTKVSADTDNYHSNSVWFSHFSGSTTTCPSFFPIRADNATIGHPYSRCTAIGMWT